MKRVMFAAMILWFVTALGFAADSASHAVELKVADICRVGLSSGADVTLTVAGAPIGGSAPVGGTDGSKALRYTSVVPAGATRRITANWGADESAPAGTALTVNAADVPAGCGVSAGCLTLSAQPQVLIDRIGSCSTGATLGAVKLRFAFQVDDLAGLTAGETKSVHVTYTLTDAS